MPGISFLGSAELYHYEPSASDAIALLESGKSC